MSATHGSRLFRGVDKKRGLRLLAAALARGGRFEVFDAGRRDRLAERLAVEDDLRHALALHQFELHYQPLVDLESEGIVGFEALLRWRHPERGIVPPLEFIGIAEDTGLIRPIGSWVLAAACADLAEWPEPVYLSVNLSAPQVSDGLVDDVEQLLTAHALRADRLMLEITGRLMLDAPAAPVVARLRALGVHVALGGFGTGYSSLSLLAHLPFDVVKLDRMLIRPMAEESGPVLAAAVVELGRALGLRVIAEGIETREQLHECAGSAACSARATSSRSPCRSRRLDGCSPARSTARAPARAGQTRHRRRRPQRSRAA